jgi:hypothetical protein
VHAQASWPELGDDLAGGPHLSVSSERGRRIPIRCERLAGPGLLLGLGQLVSPWPFHIFHISFFFISFLICFIEFANWIQINSNKILKYSIVHCSVSK